MLYFVSAHGGDENKLVEHFWQMMCLVHRCRDLPVMWKLDQLHLDAAVDFLGVQHLEDLLAVKLLGAVVEQTSAPSALVCQQATYPFELIQGS